MKTLQDDLFLDIIKCLCSDIKYSERGKSIFIMRNEIWHQITQIGMPTTTLISNYKEIFIIKDKILFISSHGFG